MKKRGLGMSGAGERNRQRQEKLPHGIEHEETKGKAVLWKREYCVWTRERAPYGEVGLVAW